MSSLFSINTELMEVQGFINSSSLQLTEKKNELERLEKALEDLDASKAAFFDNYELCTEPEFTKKTLHGDNADDIDDLQRNHLLASYVGVYYGQINEAKEQITDKMDALEQEIEDLENTISSLETQREGLKEEKKEMENENE